MLDNRRGAATAAELPIPADAATAPGAAEVLRAWVVGGGLSMSLIPAFEKPAICGLLLADVARHAARSFESEGVCSAEEAMQQIVELLQAELDAPTDVGTTRSVQKQ